MSETVHYKGKIKKIKTPNGLGLNEFAKQLCEKLNIKENDYWLKYNKGDYIKLLTDDREEYLIVKRELYEVISQDYHDAEEEIALITLNEDGTYDYEVRYYNGGAGFDEMINQCFAKLQ